MTPENLQPAAAVAPEPGRISSPEDQPKTGQDAPQGTTDPSDTLQVDGDSNDGGPGIAGMIDDGTPLKISVPPSARLKYDVKGEIKGFPWFVNGELVWQHDDNKYNARLEYSHFLLGSRLRTSTGLLTVMGLEPTRFGDKTRSEVAAHFDREKGKVSFSANTPDVPLTVGAQDQLSVFIQLAALFGGSSERFPEGSSMEFQAVGARSSETWLFKVGATEQMNLPGGAIKGIHLVRDPTGEHDSKVDVWLAPAIGYLPVRIRLSQDNGDFVEQQWSSTQNP